MFFRKWYFQGKTLEVLDERFGYGKIIPQSDSKDFKDACNFSMSKDGGPSDAACCFLLKKSFDFYNRGLIPEAMANLVLPDFSKIDFDGEEIFDCFMQEHRKIIRLCEEAAENDSRISDSSRIDSEILKFNAYRDNEGRIMVQIFAHEGEFRTIATRCL